MQESTTVESRDGLTVGDLVTVPGHGRNAPASVGHLVEIFGIKFPRSGWGWFVKVDCGDDRIVRTAFGLCRKVEA